MFSIRHGVLAFVAGVVCIAPVGGRAQHVVTDSSLSGSLLMVVPLTSLYAHRAHVPGESVRVLSVETHYTRATGDPRRAQLVFGVRSERYARDTTATTSTVIGFRIGVVGSGAAGSDTAGSGASGGRLRISSLELSGGRRLLRHRTGVSLPSVGADLVAGLGWMQSNAKGSLGLRFPVEFIIRRPVGAVAFSVVPGLGWGNVRLRSCEDFGPGDNCGDLGIQLATGVTRWMLGSSVSVGLASGVSGTVGIEQLFSPDEKPRLAVGLAFAR